MRREVAGQLWREQHHWADAAVRGERRSAREQTVSLALTVLGAVLAATAALVAPKHSLGGSMLGAAAGGAVLLSPLLGSHSARILKLAEAMAIVAAEIRSNVILFLVGVGPYVDRDGSAEFELMKKVETIRIGAAHLLYATMWSRQTDAENASLPNIKDITSYIAFRLDDQIEALYSKEASEALRRLGIARWATRIRIVLAMVAAVLAGLAAIDVLKEQRPGLESLAQR
jgi:hypothetical protein